MQAFGFEPGPARPRVGRALAGSRLAPPRHSGVQGRGLAPVLLGRASLGMRLAALAASGWRWMAKGPSRGAPGGSGSLIQVRPEWLCVRNLLGPRLEPTGSGGDEPVGLRLEAAGSAGPAPGGSGASRSSRRAQVSQLPCHGVVRSLHGEEGADRARGRRGDR